MKRRALVTSMILIAVYLVWGSVALAGYPHASFSSRPDACAGCHRVHTATSGNLIKDPTGTNLCYSCHWGGLGADTDVENGMYVAAGEDEHTWGDPDMKLLGGGFSQIKGTATTTSQHKLDTLLTPPGVDDYDDPGAAIRLVCMSCHTAHPDKNHAGQYRLLRARVNGITTPVDVAWNGPWDDETQSTKDNPDRDYRAYTERDWDPVVDGTQIYSKNYGDGISLWCTSCHTKYLTREDAEPYDAGDVYGEKIRFRHHANTSIKGVVDPNSGFTYDLSTDLPLADVSGDGRNNEDKMMCLTCHRSHGTDAVMTGEAVLSPAERVDLPTDSTLLRRDNRGVCGNCHTNI